MLHILQFLRPRPVNHMTCHSTSLTPLHDNRAMNIQLDTHINILVATMIRYGGILLVLGRRNPYFFQLLLRDQIANGRLL